MRKLMLWLSILAALGIATVQAGELVEHILPPASVESAVAQAQSNPLNFAVGIATRLTELDGVWDMPSAAIARWRLSLASAGAKNLSAELENLRLPKGAELWFRSADGVDRQGPYTQADGRSLSLPLVRADRAVLEVRMPAESRSEFSLSLPLVYHGYRRFAAGAASGSVSIAKGAIGDSEGSCHTDASCPAGNAWRNQIRAAVLLEIKGTTAIILATKGLCSATLVNNTQQDNRPLIVTANHCGVRGNTVADVTAYFNVQRPCGSATDGPINQFIKGKTFISNNASSDYTLFELASVPPSNFNVFYAGWDARGDVAPQSGASIHHPGGDDKKISLFQLPASATTANIGGIGNVKAWEVQWSSGVTEPGSSGSGLFNQDGRLVGVLSGGSSACDNPAGHDFYGRTEDAWTRDGSLKAGLDPASTGTLVLNGGNPGSSVSGGADTGSGDAASGSAYRRASGDGGGAPSSGLLLVLALAALARRKRQYQQ